MHVTPPTNIFTRYTCVCITQKKMSRRIIMLAFRGNSPPPRKGGRTKSEAGKLNTASPLIKGVLV